MKKNVLLFMMVMGSLLSCSDNETTPEENVNPDTTNKGLSLISEFNESFIFELT